MAAPQAIPLSAVAPTTAEGVDAPWWVTPIAGIGMTFMGVLLILAPGISLVVTAQVVGLYWFLDGIVRIVSIFVDRSDWGWKLLIGVLASSPALPFSSIRSGVPGSSQRWSPCTLESSASSSASAS
jgi:hypothetical protein